MSRITFVALLPLLLPVGGICVAQDTTSSGTFEYFGIGAEAVLTFGNCTEATTSIGIALMDDFSLTSETSPVRLNMRLTAFWGFSYYGAALSLRYTFWKRAYASLGYCIKDLNDPFNETGHNYCKQIASNLFQHSYGLAAIGLDFTYILLELELHRQLQAGSYVYTNTASGIFSLSGPGKPLTSILLRVSYKIPM